MEHFEVENVYICVTLQYLRFVATYKALLLHAVTIISFDFAYHVYVTILDIVINYAIILRTWKSVEVSNNTCFAETGPVTFPAAGPTR